MSTGKDKTAGELMQRLRELMLIRDTTRTTGGKGRSPGNHAALPAREPRWLPTRRPTTNRPQPRPRQYRVRFRRSPGHCVKGLLDHCLLKPKFIFIYLLSKHTVPIDQSVWPFPVGGARDTACSFPQRQGAMHNRLFVGLPRRVYKTEGALLQPPQVSPHMSTRAHRITERLTETKVTEVISCREPRSWPRGMKGTLSAGFGTCWYQVFTECSGAPPRPKILLTDRKQSDSSLRRPWGLFIRRGGNPEAHVR